MNWKKIVKRIDQDTVIEEKEEVVSLLEKMNKYFTFSERGDGMFNVMTRDIDNIKQIVNLVEAYQKHYGDRYLAFFQGDADSSAVMIETNLGKGLGIFDMRFGFFGNHYILFSGFNKDELGQKQINFLNDLVEALE
jgi:hypothetical protein